MTERERDAAWLRRVVAKDATALEAIVRQYTPYVAAIIGQMAVPPLTEEDAEELVSDTFVTLWKKAATVRDPYALKAYLAQIARHATTDRVRRRRETLPLEEDILLVAERSPESLSVLREQTAIIAEALGDMPTVRRSCMIRRYYYGEPLASIAAQLSLPLSTVKSHIYRGRRQLIETLRKGGYAYEEANGLSEFV